MSFPANSAQVQQETATPAVSEVQQLPEGLILNTSHDLMIIFRFMPRTSGFDEKWTRPSSAPFQLNDKTMWHRCSRRTSVRLKRIIVLPLAHRAQVKKRNLQVKGCRLLKCWLIIMPIAALWSRRTQFKVREEAPSQTQRPPPRRKGPCC